jgi:lipopolysaccharide biosynthesis glycosyltransferase
MIWQARNIPIFLVVIILSSDGLRYKPLVPLKILVSHFCFHHKAWGTTDNTAYIFRVIPLIESLEFEEIALGWKLAGVEIHGR